MQYRISDRLIQADDVQDAAFVEVLTKDAYGKKYDGLVRNHLLLRSMESVNHCKVDLFKRYILGTLCVPEKEDAVGSQWVCGFYMDKQKLIFIGDVEKINRTLAAIEQHRVVDMQTPAQVLFEFLETLLSSDVEFVDDFEKRLEIKEDEMAEDVNEIPKHFEEYIVRMRKELIVWNRYYKQMYEMAGFLITCPNGIIDEDAKEMLQFFSNKAERLHADTQTLREYTLQLRDMYQSRIDVRQNKVIQLLTVVTTIFMPLTLITGWYGMNFDKMPELHWGNGYIAVIVVVVVVVVLEWIIFRKKKWF